MLDATMIATAAAEITTMIGIAIAGGMGIYGAVKGVNVGLRIFSRLTSGN